MPARRSCARPAAWAHWPWASVYQVLGTWISVATCSCTASHDRLGAMAQQVAAPAGEEIEVAVAFGIPDVRTFAADQGHGVAAVVGHHVAVEQVDDCSRVHVRHRHDVRSSGRSLTKTKPSLDPPPGKFSRQPRRPPGSQLFVPGATSYAGSLGVLDDFGAHAFVRVDFQQQRVPHAAVDDVDLADALAERFQASLRPWGSCPFRSTPSRIISRAWLAVSECDQRVGVVACRGGRR